MISGLLSYIGENKETRGILEALADRIPEQQVYGLSGSQKSLLTAAIHQATDRPVLVITATEERARAVITDLAALLLDQVPQFFPAMDFVAHQVLASSKEISEQRLAVLSNCVRNKARLVALSVESLTRRLVPPEMWREGFTKLAVGEAIQPEELAVRFIEAGYHRESLVEGFGQFSWRGSIIDIYPPGLPAPVRIEIFDRDIDSIRFFDPATQRSTTKMQDIDIPPASEYAGVTNQYVSLGTKLIEKDLQNAVKRLTKAGKARAARKLSDSVTETLGRISDQLALEDLAPFFPYFCPESSSIISYLPVDTIVFLDEPARIREALIRYYQDVTETYLQLFEDGIALPGQSAGFFPPHDFWTDIKKRQLVYFSLLPKAIPELNPGHILSLSARSMELFHGRQEEVAREIRNWKKKSYATVVFAGSEERANRVTEFLDASGLKATRQWQKNESSEGRLTVLPGDLENGFEIPPFRLAVVTEQEVFGKERKKRRTSKQQPEGRAIRAFTDLKTGDYVVHVNHGIGQYLGVQGLETDGIQRDYLLIRYSGQDKLYVPIDQLELIQKYIAAEGHAPRLNRLGGSDWAKTKSRVKQSVQEMAGELLALYAARESLPGFAYSPDSVWQREFEDAFPYEETPDQIRSIKEIKEDMTRPRPMDRLLCGDVGYGKTEVGIRAAFKAVMDNRQAAVLVPTTILAQQHYNTFRERLAGYPVSIEVLSRFRSPRQQQTVMDQLELGMVDIVIGTHRLLSEDVKFKNLGLLIVDEEHRFGVAHKERIKQLRANVDVLTLTATPIPRTLHMALVGVRDMSTIETPPEDRYPVHTYVAEKTPELVRDAITKELDRGGQVFYVHNRIQDIERVTREVKQMVPGARVAHAHGQMREEQLEQVMFDFVEGEYDVLVSTTIIESGLDMPNVNTLIVDNADYLGLAQLYQLRGRVGRSNRRAYAYFTYERDKVLTEAAEKRLYAIREFTEFGSGFKIAMRDLEIRGAGNILGPEQHGHIIAVGFDLYCQLLEEAVGELKGSVITKLPGPNLDVRMDSYIPVEYIPDPGQKVDIYKRLSLTRSQEEIEELKDELIDRYGDIPQPVSNLLSISHIRVAAQGLNIESIQQERDLVRIRFSQPPASGESLVELAGKFRDRISFSTVHGLDINVKIKGLKAGEVVGILEKFFVQLKLVAGACPS